GVNTQSLQDIANNRTAEDLAAEKEFEALGLKLGEEEAADQARASYLAPDDAGSTAGAANENSGGSAAAGTGLNGTGAGRSPASVGGPTIVVQSAGFGPDGKPIMMNAQSLPNGGKASDVKMPDTGVNGGAGGADAKGKYDPWKYLRDAQQALNAN